ncbi:hypothetical protein FACS1894188_09090 [Clostridia bacterium]|nr:hypothetical protein FACS1894188_09090 [Clostridia bacterium]
MSLTGEKIVSIERISTGDSITDFGFDDQKRVSYVVYDTYIIADKNYLYVGISDGLGDKTAKFASSEQPVRIAYSRFPQGSKNRRDYIMLLTDSNYVTGVARFDGQKWNPQAEPVHENVIGWLRRGLPATYVSEQSFETSTHLADYANQENLYRTFSGVGAATFKDWYDLAVAAGFVNPHLLDGIRF